MLRQPEALAAALALVNHTNPVAVVPSEKCFRKPFHHKETVGRGWRAIFPEAAMLPSFPFRCSCSCSCCCCCCCCCCCFATTLPHNHLASLPAYPLAHTPAPPRPLTAAHAMQDPKKAAVDSFPVHCEPYFGDRWGEAEDILHFLCAPRAALLAAPSQPRCVTV